MSSKQEDCLESFSKFKINNREYGLIDIGEGECEIIITDQLSRNISDYKLLSKNHRLIVIDITPTWFNLHTLSSNDIDTITEDIHLIIDIFWLNHVNINSVRNDKKLYDNLYVKLGQRLISNYNS